MPSEYRKWWDFFRTNNKQHKEYIKWFSEHRDELPSSITSMISVGAGCGDLDSELIKTSLTGLQSYIGVEPDPDNRETLTTTMATQCPKVQLQVVAEPADLWRGPSEPVDLVLATQVFYYFTDCVRVIQQLYSWLRPGGMLIIGQNHGDNTLYAGVAKEAGLGGDYWFSNLREDIKKAGLNHYKEYKFSYTVDHGSTFNEEMVKHFYKLSVLKGEEANDVNVQKCVDIFRKRFEKSDSLWTNNNGIILLEKLP